MQSISESIDFRLNAANHGEETRLQPSLLASLLQCGGGNHALNEPPVAKLSTLVTLCEQHGLHVAIHAFYHMVPNEAFLDHVRNQQSSPKAVGPWIEVCGAMVCICLGLIGRLMMMEASTIT